MLNVAYTGCHVCFGFSKIRYNKNTKKVVRKFINFQAGRGGKGRASSILTLSATLLGLMHKHKIIKNPDDLIN
jgi:hypothetical protein